LNLITPAGAGHRPTPDVSIRVPAYWVAAMTGLFLAGAVLPSQTLFSNPQDYLALHITLEFVAMAISGMVFALAWNLRHIEFNSQIVLLGALSLIIVMVDLAHTLSFAGMPALVTPSSVEKSIFFWLTGRLVAAIALLIVAVMPLRHWRVRAWLWLILPVLVVTALVWWVGLYHLDWVPETFIQGKGLTPFKIDTEYAIAAIYALAAILLLRRSRRDGLDMTWLSAAAWVLALAELFFTLYSNVTDLFNLLGHVYKAVAYFMVYRAIFTAGVQEPYRQLGEEKSRLRSLSSTPFRISCPSRIRRVATSEPTAPSQLSVASPRLNWWVARATSSVARGIRRRCIATPPHLARVSPRDTSSGCRERPVAGPSSTRWRRRTSPPREKPWGSLRSVATSPTRSWPRIESSTSPCSTSSPDCPIGSSCVTRR
jgi:hypothetical protein